MLLCNKVEVIYLVVYYDWVATSKRYVHIVMQSSLSLLLHSWFLLPISNWAWGCGGFGVMLYFSQGSVMDSKSALPIFVLVQYYDVKSIWEEIMYCVILFRITWGHRCVITFTDRKYKTGYLFDKHILVEISNYIFWFSWDWNCSLGS